MDMGVEIKNDPEYMTEFEDRRLKIEMWHYTNKGSDNYQSFKAAYLRSRFTIEELKEGWERYKASNYICRYDYEEFEKKLFEEVDYDND